MLIIDPADLSVYRLPDDAATNAHGARVHTISFDKFEEAAHQSYSNLILASAQGAGHLIRAGSIVFVHLKGNSNTYAWASRICVHHTYEYPHVQDWTLGDDFLLLWPVPMALHTWLGAKERARAVGHAADMDAPSRLLVEHPPSLCQQKGLADIAHEGKVEPCDLSVAQRYFVASLMPNLPHFALRQSGDDWCQRLKECEPPVSKPRKVASRIAPSTNLFALPMPPPTRGIVTPDLPDELISRIVSLRLSEDLRAIETAVATVSRLGAVSRQFCACTRDTVERMLARVHPLCMQMNKHHPKSPAWVQSMLWASGLTLRCAFALDLDQWSVYVRQRRALVSHERGASEPGDAAKRHALLWD